MGFLNVLVTTAFIIFVVFLLVGFTRQMSEKHKNREKKDE